MAFTSILVALSFTDYWYKLEIFYHSNNLDCLKRIYYMITFCVGKAIDGTLFSLNLIEELKKNMSG